MTKKYNYKHKKNGKKATGRPSKIKNIDLSKVKHLSENGYTDKQLADIFCVKEQTVNNWKKDYPEFFESLKNGKLLADSKVEASLYQRACGYSHPEVHITNYQGRITKTPIIKHYPPDTMAIIYWLNNRKPEDWRNKVEHSGTMKKQVVVSDLADMNDTELKQFLSDE